MQNYDPATSTPTDAQKIIVQVAELLGVEDPEHASHDEIDQALDAVCARVTGGKSDSENDGDDGNDLTESERKACKAQGCSFRDFRQLKAGTSDSAVFGRIQQNPNARQLDRNGRRVS